MQSCWLARMSIVECGKTMLLVFVSFSSQMKFDRNSIKTNNEFGTLYASGCFFDVDWFCNWQKLFCFRSDDLFCFWKFSDAIIKKKNIIGYIRIMKFIDLKVAFCSMIICCIRKNCPSLETANKNVERYCDLQK